MGHPLRSTAAMAAAVVMTGTGVAAASAQSTEEPPVAADAASSLVFNEIESNGDTTDWAELYNTGEEPIDLSGFHFRDDDDDHDYVLPEGSVIEPGGFFVIDQPLDGEAGFDFGLGDPDAARLFAADGSTLLASTSWQEHAEVTYARCPDGAGELRQTTASTKGEANDCSLPLAINEVSAGEEGFVELINIGSWDAELEGTELNSLATGETVDSQNLSGTLAAGERTVVEGLEVASAEAVELVQDGETALDAADWSEAGSAAVTETSWGRCPDGDGAFEQTREATVGAINSCAGIAPVESWPGGADVAVADEADLVGEDLSGLYHQSGEDDSTGTLWAVENDGGTLFQLTEHEDGTWRPVEGWAAGRTLGYPDHEGTVDAEGVTMDGEGAVYAASERDNDAGSVSRPSVLRYELGGGDGETLTATDEWNLAEDFEGLGANQGLEGVTWVPDEWLTEAGFVDQSTGAAYDPAAYPDHNDGLFVVGVEGTGSIYAYALGVDGSAERIATIEPSLDVVAEVQFDAERDQLWAACDDACDGRITTLTVDDTGAFAEESSYQRPEGMENLANEGFAIAAADQCTDGTVPTFYADDGDEGDHSLRTGTFPCPDSDDSDDSDDSGKPESPGRSGQAPGHTGEAPGHSGDAPGRSGDAPGRSGEAPGRSGQAPGHARD
ncbi:lamin tail domain-containing protein [Nesterenkonia sp. F]|uniref:lamin tail domain-containing protein n=1 Tax=Nesterenkonia sp. F TaxID=795955 RepID=UPI0002F03C9A|nr:lamin tail domain-containing protein [Nesterenkonia sp. F]